MNRPLLFFALALMLILSSPAYPQRVEITSFDELKTALEVGKTIKVVVHFANCVRPESGKKSIAYPEIISGFQVGAFEFFPKNSARNNKDFISIVAGGMDEAVISKGYMYRFLKLYIYEDNKVVIHRSLVNPLTFENEAFELFETHLDYEERSISGILFTMETQ